MMTATERQSILKMGRPSVDWPAEPLLGGYYGEEEIEATLRTVRASLDPTVGFGFICEEIKSFERAFADYCGVAHCVSINGAGTGLDMAMMCLDLQEGDEVIVPSVNFRASIMSVLGFGGKVVFAEIDPVTLALDPNDVERKLTPRTRAIFPTHMNGLSAPMDDYLALAARHPHPTHGPLKVIGDGARACGGEYRGTKIGKKGWLNVFSFHTQKLMTTLGEGGAVVTDDESIVARLMGIRQFGTGIHSADPNLPGLGWGTNYKMTKVQAAVGLVQLARLDQMLAERHAVAEARTKLLEGCPGLTLPVEPADCRHTYYLYTCLVPPAWAGERRDRVMAILKERHRVDTVVANPCCHLTVPYIAANTAGQHLPVSEQIAARLFCLPMHPRLSPEDNAYICAATWEAMEEVGRG